MYIDVLYSYPKTIPFIYSTYIPFNMFDVPYCPIYSNSIKMPSIFH